MSETQVYWFDDTGRGGVRVPKSWRLLYREISTTVGAGGEWKPVPGANEFGVAKDAYNTVRLTPVMTTALRIELVMQSNRPFTRSLDGWPNFSVLALARRRSTRARRRQA